MEREIRTVSDLPAMPEEGSTLHVHPRPGVPADLELRAVIALGHHYRQVIDGTGFVLGERTDFTIEEILAEIHAAGLYLTVFGPRETEIVGEGGMRMDFYLGRVS